MEKVLNSIKMNNFTSKSVFQLLAKFPVKLLTHKVHNIVYSNSLSCFLVLMNNCVVVSKKNQIVKAYMKSTRVKKFLEQSLDEHLSSLTLMSRLVFLMSNLSQVYTQEDFLPLLIKFFDRLLIFLKNSGKFLNYSLIDLSSLFNLVNYFLSTIDFDLFIIKTNFTQSIKYILMIYKYLTSEYAMLEEIIFQILRLGLNLINFQFIEDQITKMVCKQKVEGVVLHMSSFKTPKNPTHLHDLLIDLKNLKNAGELFIILLMNLSKKKKIIKTFSLKGISFVFY